MKGNEIRRIVFHTLLLVFTAGIVCSGKAVVAAQMTEYANGASITLDDYTLWITPEWTSSPWTKDGRHRGWRFRYQPEGGTSKDSGPSISLAAEPTVGETIEDAFAAQDRMLNTIRDTYSDGFLRRTCPWPGAVRSYCGITTRATPCSSSFPISTTGSMICMHGSRAKWRRFPHRQTDFWLPSPSPDRSLTGRRQPLRQATSRSPCPVLRKPCRGKMEAQSQKQPPQKITPLTNPCPVPRTRASLLLYKMTQ